VTEKYPFLSDCLVLLAFSAIDAESRFTFEMSFIHVCKWSLFADYTHCTLVGDWMLHLTGVVPSQRATDKGFLQRDSVWFVIFFLFGKSRDRCELDRRELTE